MNDHPDARKESAARNRCVLAIDIGSSSSRAALVDAKGFRVSNTFVQMDYDLQTTPDGGAVLDPEMLAQTIETIIDRLLASAGPHEHANEIAAVALTTFWHSLLGLDESDRPATPVYTWADTRAAAAAPELAGLLDETDYHQRTGSRLHPSYPATKLYWLRQTSPEIWQRTSRWLSFGEYLFMRFFGEATCSISMASGTGLFDQQRQVWDEPTLQALGMSEQVLSPIDDRPSHQLRSHYAARWPQLNGIPWFPALGDGACSNVGSGAVGSDRIALMVGTTGAMRLLWSGAPIEPPSGLWQYRLDHERVVLGGALSEGGNLFEWVVERFRLPDEGQLEEQLAAIPPDGHGLTWLPFLAGERSPGWAADARGAIYGLTLDTAPVAILRAGLEAISFRFALIARHLQAVVPGRPTIIATGNGLLRNPAWLQITADALGYPVLASSETEASLRGAALIALERIGLIDDLRRVAGRALREATPYEPDPERHATYLTAIERQQRLYRALVSDSPLKD